MKLLATITQKDIDPSYVGAGEIKYRERKAARAVLLDSSGKVALLYSSKNDYYKLPGGGVEDDDEDIYQTLKRELLEEVGANSEVVSEIGRIEEWREFEDGRGLHQISDAFVAKVVGEIGQPDFTESEIEKGLQVVWANDIDRAVEKVESGLENDDIQIRFMNLRDSIILKAVQAS